MTTCASDTGNESCLLVDPERDGTKPAVSVIIPAAKETYERIQPCLDALLEQDITEPYEIIVIADRGSSLAADFRARFPKVRVGYCEKGVGPGGARNCGIEMAQGDILAFTDSDCLPDRDWLRLLLDACRRRGGRPLAGWVETGYPESYVSRAADFAERGTARPKAPVPISGLMGSNMCLSREWFKNPAAGFAEGVYGAEEIALLVSLTASCLPVTMEPAAQVRHMRRDPLFQSLRRFYRLGRGSGQVRKYEPMRGSFFAHHVWLTPLLVPARLFLACARLVHCDWQARLDFAFLLPLVLCQWMCYAVGFAVGAVSQPLGSDVCPSEEESQ